MEYYSLNKKAEDVSFKEATINGQAPDKGLYFPKYIPQLTKEWMKNIETEMPDVSDKFGTWVGYTEFLCKLRDGIKHNDVDNTTIRRAFVNWFDDFDRKRNLNFVNTFPELANFYNEYKTGE